MGKQKGRVSMIEKLSVSREMLAKLYVDLGSHAEVAKRFGVTDRTVRNWFRHFKMRGTYAKYHVMPEEVSSKIGRWFRANHGVAVPRSVKRAAALLEVNPNCLESYLERKRRKVLAYVQELGDLREIPKTITLEKGYLPLRGILSYSVHVDRWTLVVTYTCEMKAGTTLVWRLPYSECVRWWRAVRDDEGVR